MRRYFGAGRVEVIDNALPVDAHGDGLTHAHVIERRVGIGHADVEDVQRRTFQQLQVRVAADRLEVVRAGVVDAVNRAGLELEQTGGRFGLPTENQGVGEGRLAPIAGILGEDDLFATPPFLDHVGAGANRMLQEFAAAALSFKVLRRLDAEGREGYLRRESRVGPAQGELDGHRIERGDLAHQAGIGLIGAIGGVGHQISGRFFGRGFGRGFCAAGQFGRRRLNGRADFFDSGRDSRGQFGSRRGQGRRDFLGGRFERRRYFINRLLDFPACSSTGGDGQSGEEK